MNCTQVDDALTDAQAFLLETDFGVGILAACIVLASSVLLFYGERVVKPACVLVGGAGGAVSLFVLTDSASVSCYVRLGAAGLAGVVVGLLALTLVKSGIFILGAAAFATVTHYVYSSLPLDGVASPFTMLGMSGWYVISMASSIVVGAIVSHLRRKQLIRVITALLGSGGIVAALHLVLDRSGEGDAFPAFVYALLLLPGTALGTCAQRVLARRRRARVAKPPDVPVGIRVEAA